VVLFCGSAIRRQELVRRQAALDPAIANALQAGHTLGDFVNFRKASSLELSESGLARNQPLTPGQNLTRILALRADGLPAETLPPFEEIQVPGIRTYPESPERETETTNAGLSSSLSQATALVPVQAGDLILPEIRIPWWDT